ncbi:MAG: sigma-70 family RNA polymerase sigma factor [Acidimicrobiia bacterium]|nr:sigma-70 family RNA polymerase sigma factor [Acidimicrobiia bacterium]
MNISSKPPASKPSETSSADAFDIDGVVRRDQSALARIYDRLGGAIYGLSRQVLKDDGLAQDVTQEIFLRLWNEPKRFDTERGSLRSFLLREAHSRSIEKVRSEEARRQRESRSESLDRPALRDTEDDVLRSLTSNDVRNALSQLPGGERSAIVLAYYGGHSYREVANVLDTPEGTVKSRIRSGLMKLSLILTDEGSEAKR